MSPLPNAEREIAELKEFLAIDLPGSLQGNASLRELRQRAERLSLRLSNPVRVAIIGLPGTGKSTLAGFLAGRSYALARNPAGAALPVILRFGERAISFAGWWSGIEIPQNGIDLVGAAEHNPDYVEMRLPNPVLQHLSFLDLPGAPDWPAQKDQMRWVSGRADVLIWCTNAIDPWTSDEWQLWSLVPRRLQTRSILVATHLDRPEASDASPPVAEQLARTTREQFQAVLAIATPAAFAAAPSGQVTDAGAWERSGGMAMVGALLTAARTARRADIVTAREIVLAAEGLLAEALPDFDIRSRAEAAPSTDILEASPETPAEPTAEVPEAEPPAEAMDTGKAPAEEVDAPPPDAERTPEPEAEVASTAATEAASGQSPILDMLAARIDDLVTYAEDEAGFKDWEFMTRITDIGDELSAMLVHRPALSNEGQWVRGQVEEAFVTLSLLQMETGERPRIDAATVLLQLARDLAWATAPVEA